MGLSSRVHSWLLLLFGVAILGLSPGAAQADSKRCGDSLRKAYCDQLHCEAASSPAKACQVLNDIHRARAGFSILCDDRTVRLLGAFDESEAEVLNQELALFTEQTGIPVHVEGVNVEEEADKLIACGADGLFVPQAGLIKDLAAQGQLVDLSTFVNMEEVEADFSETLRETLTFDGGLYGMWTFLHPKSLIWYPVEAFEAKGYQVPTSWDELLDLSDQIVADGGRPWCMYFESGDATGWLLTDWIEDIVLRLPNGPEIYDRWTSHEVLFSDPPIREAFDHLGEILFTADYVFDPEHIATIPFVCAFFPMFGLPPDLFGEACLDVPVVANPPGCWLHRQGDFARFFTAESNVGVFSFPPFDPNLPHVEMGNGLAAVLTRDTPEGRAVFNYLLSRNFGEVVAANGGVLANRNVPAEWYQQSGAVSYAEQIRSALRSDGFRFDASDLMPFEVGAGSFWYYATQFALGASTDEVTAAIDASWPEAQP